MSISIQTNVASLNAQYYVSQNQNFQNTAIEQLSSGYKINSSADDPAGLAVVNQYAGEITQLTQGVQNASDGTSTLQIADGGLSNISQILGRLQTLASESASGTFQGNRTTVDNEYQGLLTEINRQAANIGLNTGGVNNTNLTVYTGGGSTQGNSQVTVDLSGANNAVDTTALGIGTTSVTGGGTGISSNNVNLNNTAVSFLTGTSQTFTFNINTGSGAQTQSIVVAGGGSGLSGTQVISSLDNQLQAYGINASIGSNGFLQFGGSTAFTVSTTAAGTGPISTTGTAVNSANYSLSSTTEASGYVPVSGLNDEKFTVQNAGGSYNVDLGAVTGLTTGSALTAINSALSGSGIYAVAAPDSNDITFQSSNVFSVNETQLASTGGLFTTLGAQTPTAPAASASDTGNALAALTLLTQAISNLGLVQGNVGAGENKLQYASNLAQSQITNVSAAESGLRDADVAAAAANLTKAQVLQQTSLAALSQANSAPQAVLALLKNF
jgi:flagellin-like hook-associated protein FlgL